MATPRKHHGLNPEAKLNRSVLDSTKLPARPTRDGYGEGLLELGASDKRVVVLCADLSESTRSLWFKEKYPERFVQMGVSEQALASIAAGMALAGKIPFISSYASFSPGRNWEQLRTAAALQNTPVKIAGAHAGVSVGPDGATHQMTEDIAIMRVVPNMVVLVPCDVHETRKATVAAAKTSGPVYLRFTRDKSPIFTTNQTPFKIGRAETFRFGDDLTIIAAGPLLYEALLAADQLSREQGIEARVIDCHSVKPLDVKTIVQTAKETGAIVTVEEAQAAGGLGGAVCEALAANAPVPVERVGMPDCFGESGTPSQLLDGFGLTAPSIAAAAIRVLKRKHGERVPHVPEYIAAAAERLEAMKQQTLTESLSRTPKKWGGKQPDNTLKSRTTKPA